jgi:hypothetical protein
VNRVAFRRPRQAEPDDPRWQEWLERLRADLEWFEGILVLEGDANASSLESCREALRDLVAQREVALKLDGVQRHVQLRTVNGQILEQWRAVRWIARVGGGFKQNYGATKLPQVTR